MQNYFLNCHTEESVKIRFRALSKHHHPDVCKDANATEIFQEIERQRGETMKAIWKKSGKSDQEIEFMFEDLIKSTSALKSYTDKIADHFSNADKPPTFSEIFKFVFNDLVQKEGSDQKKKLGE